MDTDAHDLSDVELDCPDGIPQTSKTTKRLTLSIRGSVVAAAVLLAFEVLTGGSLLWSMMLCPIWFFISLVNNTTQLPGWRIGLLRIGIPALMFGLVLAYDASQRRVAKANAQRLVAACEAYHGANGRFPEKLDELVPQYMFYVPPARYCPGPWSEFVYINISGDPIFFLVHCSPVWPENLQL